VAETRSNLNDASLFASGLCVAIETRVAIDRERDMLPMKLVSRNGPRAGRYALGQHDAVDRF
jgi:hypothetical protein